MTVFGHASCMYSKVGENARMFPLNSAARWRSVERLIERLRIRKHSLQSWASHAGSLLTPAPSAVSRCGVPCGEGSGALAASGACTQGMLSVFSDGNNLSLESFGPRRHWVLEHCATWPPDEEHLFFSPQRNLLKAVQWSWEIIVYSKLRVVSPDTHDCIWIHRSIWWPICLSLFISMEKDVCLCICLWIRKEAN